MNRSFAYIAAALIVLPALPDGLKAADAPREIRWVELMPPADSMPSPLKPKAFFSGSTTAPPDGGPPPPPLPEGKWLSFKRKQPGADQPPRVVADLNGKRVKIGGYVVPLDFESTTVKEFLLVPFVGACIHVPPPPSNQIVYVKSDKGFEISDAFDPVTVTGTIKTETAFTGLADAGYSLEAETVERRTQ
jgi:uncharacterized protein